jgi:flagellar biosynthesis protein FlhB
LSREGGGEPTEEPTAERVWKARQRGQVAVSRELSSALALLALIAVIAGSAASGMARLLALFRAAFALPSLSVPAVSAVSYVSSLSSVSPARPSAIAAFTALGGHGLAVAVALSAPPLLAALAAGVLATALQTGGLFTWHGLRPDFTRLSPAAGLGRVFGARTPIEMGKGLLKVGVIAAVAAATLGPAARDLPRLVGAAPASTLGLWGQLAGRLGLRVALALATLGTIDWLLVRRRHRRSLMMTRDEVKRERKDVEGDPHHKAERQRLHRQLSEQRMLADIRKADFVVVNPEHIAVAVRYDRDSDAAPVILAKGKRLMAEQIKEVARAAGVPIYRDIGLARALHEITEGDEIPEALYEAVAELLRALWELERPPPPPTSGSSPATSSAAAERPGEPRRPTATWKRV